MLGCESAAAARASRSKRERSALGASVLTATRRPSSSSSASQTELIGAAPERLEQAVAPRDQIPGHAGDYREVGVDDLPGIDEALDQVLARVQPLAAEAVPVAAAAGRVLAQDARAVVDLPPFASSAMDGYAVRASDTPGRLPVGGQSAAGSPLGRPQDAGEAVVISTGAVVPEGADAVVPVEVTRAGRRRRPGRGGERRRARSPAWRRCAQRRDDRLPRASCSGRPRSVRSRRSGSRPSSARAGRRSPCSRPASELRAPGETLGPGEIYESNTALIAAQVRSAGGEPRRARPGRRRRRAQRARRSRAGSSRTC